MKCCTFSIKLVGPEHCIELGKLYKQVSARLARKNVQTVTKCVRYSVFGFDVDRSNHSQLAFSSRKRQLR
jgi:hypothetical protein